MDSWNVDADQETQAREGVYTLVPRLEGGAYAVYADGSYVAWEADRPAPSAPMVRG